MGAQHTDGPRPVRGLGLLWALALVCLQACTTSPSSPIAPSEQPIAPAQLAGWSAEGFEGLGAAIDHQCRLPRVPAPWVRLCAQRPSNATPADWRRWLETRFIARPMLASLASGTRTDQGLITGYFEPQLTGSRLRERAEQVPVLPVMDDVIAGGSAWTRQAIETNTQLASRALLWLDDPVDAFFLHVQGSGQVRVREPNGLQRTVRLAYAGHNGHSYSAIGRVMVAQGLLTREQADAPGIQQWLRAHPLRRDELLRTNARYIFFSEQSLPRAVGEGPRGAMGVPLTALRSIAIDPQHVALGSLVWVDTAHPVTQAPLRRLMLAQDTGSAILGPVRVDVFWGTGPEAERAAGMARGQGRVWVLEPR